MATSSPSAPCTATDRPRLLVVGAGSRTTGVLLPALARAGLPVTVAAICDPDPAVRDRVTELNSAGLVPADIPVFTDLDQALAAGQYEVATLACPHDQHHQLVLRLTAANVTVWKEKPYALTLEDALQLATRNVRVLAHRPHGQLFQIAADRLATWGRLLSYRIRITRPTGDYSRTWRADPERAGGGAICDLGYHAFDLIARLTAADRPSTVYAITTGSPTHRATVEVEENAHLTVLHAGTCAGTVYLSRCEERADEIHLVAEHGRIHLISDSSGDRAFIGITTRGGVIRSVELTAGDDPWAAMLEHHARTFAQSTITTAEARTALTATAMQEAAYTSLRLRRPAPVADIAETALTTSAPAGSAACLEGLAS